MKIDPEIKIKYSELRRMMRLSEKIALLQHGVMPPDEFTQWVMDNYIKYWQSDMVEPSLADKGKT